MVRFKNRYVLVELNFSDEEAITEVATHELQNAIRESVLSNYGDLGAAKVAFSLQVKYLNSTVKLAIIRVGRDYLSILANSLTFLTSINGRPVKLRQLHCSGTIKKIEVHARYILSMWLNNVLKKLILNPEETQELKTMIATEIDTLSKIEQ